MKSNIVFSHNSDDWKTPSKLYNILIDHGFIDPCPYKCSVDNFGKLYENSFIFINPPYSEISKWVDYAIDLSKHNKLVLLLIPSRTDTKYFNKLFDNNVELWFFTGRLHFNDSNCAPFPSVMVSLRHKLSLPIYRFGTIDDFIKEYLHVS